MTADSKTTTQNIWKEVSQEMNDVYGPHLKEATTVEMPKQIAAGNEPEVVVNQVLGLLEKKKWRPSYLVGNDVKVLGPMWKVLPARTLESILQKAAKIPQYKG